MNGMFFSKFMYVHVQGFIKTFNKQQISVNVKLNKKAFSHFQGVRQAQLKADPTNAPTAKWFLPRAAEAQWFLSLAQQDGVGLPADEAAPGELQRATQGGEEGPEAHPSAGHHQDGLLLRGRVLQPAGRQHVLPV